VMLPLFVVRAVHGPAPFVAVGIAGLAAVSHG
jgi:hypothetical protein